MNASMVCTPVNTDVVPKFAPMGSGLGGASKKRTDLNPIAPCGACSEWLKKIAEREPNFRIITFDTVACDSIYVKRVNLF